MIPADLTRQPVALVLDARMLLGEGPVWVERERALWCVDIATPRLWRWRWDGGVTECWTPPWRVSALAPRAAGGFVAATEMGFALIDPLAARYDLLVDPEPLLPGNRCNDGKVDPFGHFWAGTMDDRELSATGALYRLRGDLTVERLDTGYHVTNGPAFDAERGLAYHTDSVRRQVYRFAHASDGTVGERTEFLRFEEPDGHPDGMTVDAEGCLWIAFWGGGCIRRFTPGGAACGRIDLPVPRPTSVAFGGPGHEILFVTSARTGLSDETLAAAPLSGALFALRPGVRGLPQPPFAG